MKTIEYRLAGRLDTHEGTHCQILNQHLSEGFKIVAVTPCPNQPGTLDFHLQRETENTESETV